MMQCSSITAVKFTDHIHIETVQQGIYNDIEIAVCLSKRIDVSASSVKT